MDFADSAWYRVKIKKRHKNRQIPEYSKYEVSYETNFLCTYKVHKGFKKRLEEFETNESIETVQTAACYDQLE